MPEPRVVFVTFPDAQILDLTGPLEVFSTANQQVPAAAYRTIVASTSAEPITATCGLTYATTPLSAVRAPVDTLVVVGGKGTRAAVFDPEVLHHVQRLGAGARRVTSVCTGAFVLAAAGLVQGRNVTTHWEYCDLLAQSFDDLTVEPDSIYVRDGNVWTSAGVTAGIDLALALLADDHGQQAAAAVARQLVVYLRRSGGQRQFSVPLAAQAAEREPLRELQSWILDHLADDLSVTALARRMNLSERQATRVFQAELGQTPASYVETMRVESACRLLETTQLPAERIAALCGFGTPETLHRSFRRRMSTTPGDYRRHFRAAG